jgi:hypothetical protein
MGCVGTGIGEGGGVILRNASSEILRSNSTRIHTLDMIKVPWTLVTH